MQVQHNLQSLHAGVREPQCPCNSWGAVTASALNDMYNFLSVQTRQPSAKTSQNPSAPPIPEAAQSAIKSVKLDSVVMIAHSLGAYVACLLLTGLPHCFLVAFCFVAQQMFTLLHRLQTQQNCLHLSFFHCCKGCIPACGGQVLRHVTCIQLRSMPSNRVFTATM